MASFANMLGSRFRAQSPRFDPRFLTEGLLRSHAGDVINLSSSGMRIRSERKPHYRKGDVEVFAVRSDAKQIHIHAKVVWVRRTSFLARTYDVGIRFLDTRPEMRSALLQMAQHGFMGADARRSTDATGAGGAKRKRVIEADLEIEDLYAILGVARNATDEQIRTAYRKLATRLHPDVCDDPDAEQRFVLVNKAYRVLRSPDIRRRYDDMLDDARTAA